MVPAGRPKSAGGGNEGTVPRPEGNRARVGDEERIEDVDEVGIVGRLVVEDMDPHAEAGEGIDQPVVLAPGPIEVDRSEKAVGGIVECPPEGRPGPLDEDVAEGRGRAPRAPGALGRHHRPRIRRPTPFSVAVARSSLPP